MPLCQVRFFQLTSPASKPYGSTELGSLYIDDDGGPSYWWRDKRIAKLQTVLGTTSVELTVQSRIFDIVGHQEPEVLERLENDIAESRIRDLSNADSLLEQCADREDRRRRRRQRLLRIRQGLFTVGFALILLTTRADMAPWRSYIWSAAAATLVISVLAFGKEIGDYLGQRELRRLRNQ